MHNIFAIKFQIFCNMVLVELEKLQVMDRNKTDAIRK